MAAGPPVGHAAVCAIRAGPGSSCSGSLRGTSVAQGSPPASYTFRDQVFFAWCGTCRLGCGSPPFSSLFGRGLRRISVALGSSPAFFRRGSVSSEAPPFALRVLLHVASSVVPLARATLGILFLCLCRLLCSALPGRASPLGRLLSLPCAGVPAQGITGLGCCARPSLPILTWTPPAPTRARGACRAAYGGASLRSCFWVWFLSGLGCPLPVWGMPPVEPATLQEFSRLADATAASAVSPERSDAGLFPDPLLVFHANEPGTGDVTGPELGGVVSSFADTSVAESAEQRTSGAAGAGHSGPILRFLVYVPGHVSLELLLPYPGPDGVGSLLARAGSGLEPRFPADRWELHPVLPQLRDDYGSLVLAPRWLSHSGRRVVVFDLSAFLEPTYACFFDADFGFDDVLAVAEQHALDPFPAVPRHCGPARGAPWTMDTSSGSSGRTTHLRRVCPSLAICR